MTIDDTRLVKDMLIACEGIDDLEDCMVAALHVVKEAYEQAKKPDSANTALVKKMVDALKYYSNPSDYVAPYTGGNGKLYFDCGNTAKEALTEANAYLERISHDK